MIKIGIVGAGKIVPPFLEALNEVKSLCADAIYARREEASRPIAEQFGIKKIYTDYDALLGDSEVDVIYVAILNHLHYEFAKKALESGKHVILEKPFTVSLKQADALIELAKSKGLFLFEAITNLYNPNFYAIKELISKLGKIGIAQFNYSQYSSRYENFLRGEALPVFRADCAGGALTDLGIYNIHLATELFGEPQSVKYMANMEKGVDTSGILLLEYPNLKCVCVCAKDSNSPCYVSIQGDKASLYTDDKPGELTHFTLRYSNSQTEEYALTHGEPRLSFQLAAFAEHYENNDKSFFDERLAHSRVAMKVLDAAIKDGGMGYKGEI